MYKACIFKLRGSPLMESGSTGLVFAKYMYESSDALEQFVLLFSKKMLYTSLSED